MADYDVEVELVDGHMLTVRVEDREDAFVAASSIGYEIVKRARAKLIARACPLCWNSGVEREGAYVGGIVRRVICSCPHGQELLAAHDPRKYTSDPTKANLEPEAEARPRTDGVRGMEGETFGVMCLPGECGPLLPKPDGEGVKHVHRCEHGRVFVWGQGPDGGWEPMPVEGEEGWKPAQLAEKLNRG